VHHTCDSIPAGSSPLSTRTLLDTGLSFGTPAASPSRTSKRQAWQLKAAAECNKCRFRQGSERNTPGTWSPARAGTFKSSSFVLRKCHLKHLSCFLVPLSQVRKVSEKVNTNMISLLAITRQLLKSRRDTQQKYLQRSSEKEEKKKRTPDQILPTGKKPSPAATKK